MCKNRCYLPQEFRISQALSSDLFFLACLIIGSFHDAREATCKMKPIYKLQCSKNEGILSAEVDVSVEMLRPECPLEQLQPVFLVI